MRSFYTALFYAATPLIVGRLWWRSIKAPEYRKRVPERFGYYTEGVATGCLWLHAVSVGEAEAAFPLLRALRERYPDIPILVTTTTPTGSARVKAVLGDSVAHVYLPYDLPGAINRFFSTFAPRLAIVMETEIWPNLYRAMANRNLPLIIVNGRLSERSAKGYARLQRLTRDALNAVTWIAAQSEADARRFTGLGAEAERVDAVGNIKFDVELPEGMQEQCAELRRQLFGNRPVLIAGSTHAGEELAVLDAARTLWASYPDLLVILVPRHPERFGEVAELCNREGLRLSRRSESNAASDAQIFLLDTMGELRLFYGVSDVAFVGGSLVAKGGHNLLEPLTLGVPVLFGPHMFNFRDMTRGVLEAGCGRQVSGAGEFAEAAAHLLGNAAARNDMAARGEAFVRQGRGALQKVVERLDKWLIP